MGGEYSDQLLMTEQRASNAYAQLMTALPLASLDHGKLGTIAYVLNERSASDPHFDQRVDRLALLTDKPLPVITHVFAEELQSLLHEQLERLGNEKPVIRILLEERIKQLEYNQQQKPEAPVEFGVVSIADFPEWFKKMKNQ